MSGLVFICYSRKDENFAFQLATNLKREGVSVWLDQWDIPSGANWDRTIEKALDECDRLLLVLSPSSVESDEVQCEWRSALDAKKVIIPILHKPCDIPYRLTSIQYIDFISRGPDDEEAIGQIMNALGKARSTGNKEPVAQTKETPKLHLSTPTFDLKPQEKVIRDLARAGLNLKDNKIIATAVLSILIIAVVLWFPKGPTSTSESSLLQYATLKDSDYGMGTPIVPTTGIRDSSEGIKFVPTESNGQSNALINWVIPSDRRAQFRSNGTVSFMFKADRQNHIDGEILGENYGLTQFNYGQGTFGAACYRIANGLGVEDDQFYIRWSTWHNGIWQHHPPVGQPNIILEYDRWYDLGFAWGGPANSFEIWVCGVLRSEDSQISATLPWGDAKMGTGSGTNIGLGDNHERTIGKYGSASGVTFADIRIWDEYREYGDTELC